MTKHFSVMYHFRTFSCMTISSAILEIHARKKTACINFVFIINEYSRNLFLYRLVMKREFWWILLTIFYSWRVQWNIKSAQRYCFSKLTTTLQKQKWKKQTDIISIYDFFTICWMLKKQISSDYDKTKNRSEQTNENSINNTFEKIVHEQSDLSTEKNDATNKFETIFNW